MLKCQKYRSLLLSAKHKIAQHHSATTAAIKRRELEVVTFAQAAAVLLAVAKQDKA